jgi:dipeptidyl aminopeptidase/acylaminoacyl peptidase
MPLTRLATLRLPRPHRRTALLPLLGLALLAARGSAGAQGAGAAPPRAAAPSPLDEAIAAERYIAPPATVAELVTAPRERNVTLGAPNPGTREWFLRPLSDGLPTLAAMAKPYHNLGGFQVDQRASRARSLTTRSAAGLELRHAETGRVVTVEVPRGARVGPTAWSPDGRTLAFLALFDDATHVWLADPSTGRSRPLTRTPLLATHVTSVEWTADSRHIVAVLQPAGRGAEPAAPAVATEPIVRVNEENKLKTRTYASLLATPHDKALLEYHSRGQLAVIDVRTRVERPVGAPMRIRALSASPDGAHFRVTTLDEPFSYLLPVASFGSTESVLDARGQALVQLASRPMREGEDPDAPPAPPSAAARAAADTGRRLLQWHPTAAGLLYAQAVRPPARGATNAPARPAGDSAARPAGDSAARATPARGDRLLHWLPPFDSTSVRAIYDTPNRIAAVRFSEDGRLLFVSETGAGGTTEIAVALDEPARRYTVLAPRRVARDSSGADSTARTAPATGRPAATGSVTLVTVPGRRGTPSVLTSADGSTAYLQGSTPDSSAERAERAARVWIDRVAIRTGERTRLYESTGDATESIATVLDADAGRLIVTRESPTAPPQSFLLTTATGEARQLTQNVDLFPALTAAQRRTVTARRADGYAFTVRVTLPADYTPGTRLPALFWFYPREYQDQEAYDRAAGGGSGGGARRFATFGPRSMAFLTTQGYAVVEPDAPIFAANGLPPNDNYVADLRNNLAATIDALDTLQLIDRHRLGIGGHSYGAFSAVNAMVHTPFFKAGIAGDGAYNRTLTPNGFQSERRDFWQGRETYLAMSPFLFADKLNGALLLYHSTDDQNVGTAPINSERLFHALQGLGKNVSLYMYPYEDHGPVARETVLDQWARWIAWLDKYVKGDGRPKASVTSLQDAP